MYPDYIVHGIWQYVQLFVFTLIAYILGRRIILNFSFDSIYESFAISTGLGLGILITLTFILGLFGILHAWLIASTLVIGILFSYPVYKSWPAQIISVIKDRSTALRSIFLIVIPSVLLILILLPIFEFPLYPPTGYDATSYHLPLARYFSQWHEIRLAPYLRLLSFQ